MTFETPSEYELTVLPTEKQQLERFFIKPDEQVLTDLLSEIRAIGTDLPDDMSKKKNRDELASFAYKIAHFKTAVDKAGAELKAEYVEILKKIDATRRLYKDALEGLQHEVRKLVTDWEEAEKKPRYPATLQSRRPRQRGK